MHRHQRTGLKIERLYIFVASCCAMASSSIEGLFSNWFNVAAAKEGEEVPSALSTPVCQWVHKIHCDETAYESFFHSAPRVLLHSGTPATKVFCVFFVLSQQIRSISSIMRVVVFAHTQSWEPCRKIHYCSCTDKVVSGSDRMENGM